MEPVKNQKKHVLYDLTYATRGLSGIPGDTRSVAKILNRIFEQNCDLLLFPKSFVRRRAVNAVGMDGVAPYLGAALKKNPGRSLLPSRLIQILVILQSKSFRRKVELLRVHSDVHDYSLSSLKISDEQGFRGDLYVATIGNSSRFARSPKRKNFRINTSSYEFFVQQQIDPISVSKNTKHIVRLHDILPITHPQYFDDLAIEVFARGLRALLKNREILWVFDSKASSEEFRKLFGSFRKVTYIPCAVGTHFASVPTEIIKNENRICIVNTIEPRKNVSKVIEEFKAAKSLGLIPGDYILSILGSKGWQDETLHSSLVSKKFGNDVEFIEAPTNDTVATYLQKSRLVVSASSAEGFGLPPLEGMLFGCAPVLSDIPQHRETVGDHGFYFKNTDSSLRNAFAQAHEKAKNMNPSDVAEIQRHVIDNYGDQRIQELWANLLS
jgi:glycosyltransferase involved in cell wall biosynthesis